MGLEEKMGLEEMGLGNCVGRAAVAAGRRMD
jgi:hypothetical protein